MIEDDEQETIQSVKQPNFLFPDVDRIEQAVPVLPSELAKKQKSLEYKLPEFEFSPIPELKPLSFTVGENFFDLEESCDERWTKAEIKNVNKFIENRGLLILIETKYKKLSYVELRFPTKKGFGISESDEEYFEETSETAKTKIYFYKIESISLNKGLLKASLIIKLRPLEQYQKIHRLLVDQVEREIVLYIKRKDSKLAEQIVSTVEMWISEYELKKLLK